MKNLHSFCEWSVTQKAVCPNESSSSLYIRPMQSQDEPPVVVSEQVEGPVSNQRDREVSHQRRVEIVHEDHEDSENEDLPPNLNGCFSSEGFDTQRFEAFAREFLRDEPETRQDLDNQRKEKAKIVSVLAQNLYIMCTLSKDQIKNITHFWKAMISFIAPEYTDVAKRIHASYSSCLRHAERRRVELEARQTQMFRDCLYFSLALDTAQFGRDNFLSCVCRFGFDYCIVQEIVMFDKISEKKTGGIWQKSSLKNSRRKIAIFQRWFPSRLMGPKT